MTVDTFLDNPSLPLDFLFVAPKVSAALLNAQVLSSWWRRVWEDWHATQWPVTDLDSVESGTAPQNIALHAPVWMSSSSHFQVERGTKTCGLLMVTKLELAFRLRFIAVTQIRSLLDVYGLFNGWPGIGAFLNEFVPRIRSSARGGVQTRWLIQLHADLTVVARRCPADFAQQSPTPHGSVPVCGVAHARRVRLFPHVPPSMLREVIQADAPHDAHPLTQHLDSRHCGGSSRVLSQTYALRRHLLPVFHDVWLRLLFYTLPVGSRFWWLQQSNPDAIICPQPDCSAVETYAHRFLECNSARELWGWIWGDWAQFFGCPLTWSTLISTPSPPSTSLWHDHRDIIALLWHMMRLITLRVLWIDRNKIVFESARPRSTLAMCIEVHVLFAAHYRALLRRSNADELSTIDQVLRTLLATPTFGSFFDERHDLLGVRRRQPPSRPNVRRL